MEQDSEFYFSLIVFGTIIVLGIGLIIGIGLLAMAVYNRKTKQNVTKEIYDEKERNNGQHKGGSRGGW